MVQATRMGASHPSGLEIGGVPLAIAPGGKVFYVHDNDTTRPHASNGNSGLTADKPLATIDAAIGKCTANRGDIILVLPGHTEAITAASAVDFDVAGVKCIGLGHGSDMATIDFTGASGTVAIGADNVTLENLRFLANVTTVTDGVIVEDGVNRAHIKGCRWEVNTAGTDEFSDCLVFTNNNAYCLVEDCFMDMGIAAAVTGIHLDADTDNLTIRRCTIQGDYSTANIQGDTTLSTDLLIEDCTLINGEAGDLGTVECIELLTGTKGIIRNNLLITNVATPDLAIVSPGTGTFRSGNMYSETVAEEAIPISGTTSNSAFLPAVGPRAFESTGVSLTGGNVVDVATANNGAVLIHMIALEITTAVSANAALLSFDSDPTRGASSSDMTEGTGAPDIASAAVGDWFATNGGSQDVMVKYANGTEVPELASATSNGVVLPEGGLDLALSTSDPTTGAGTLHILYTPLTPDAYLS